MPRLLVLYGTHDGHTAKIAHVVGEEARGSGWDPEIWHCKDIPVDFSLAPYAAVMVAAPVMAERYPGYVAKVVRTHHAALGSRPNAFLSVSWSALNTAWAPRPEQRERANARFFRQTGWRPQRIISVAGAVLYTRHNRLARWVWSLFIRRACGPNDLARDYDFTDWEAVRRETRAFLGAAVQPVAAAS